MAIPSIAILGGDLRQCYCAEYLLSVGWQVTCFHTPDFPFHGSIRIAGCLPQALEGTNIILAPTPLSKDNTWLFQADTQKPPCLLASLWDSLLPGQTLAAPSFGEETRLLLQEKSCRALQLSQAREYAVENSLLTAEGLLSEVIQKTPFSLSSAHVLLLGYGCCGSAIGKMLLPICRSITVLEWELGRQAQAKKDGICPVAAGSLPNVLPTCSLLINTIPAHVLEPQLMQKLPGSCHIFDIASAPFGFSKNITEKYLMPYFRVPGIPGRFSPATAGQVIGKTIERISDYGL